MYRRFRFEGDIHETLACVPLAVRRKLDLSAFKLSLTGWQQLPYAERLALCHLPVDTEEERTIYRTILNGFAERASVTLSMLAPVDASTWGPDKVPPGLPAAAWRALDEDCRFAVTKLSDPKHDPAKLNTLLAELGLAPEPSVPFCPEHLVCNRLQPK